MSTQAPTGVLLINLGTPEAPTTRAVRRYLKQFLSDPRVIDIPALARWLLLRLVILPFRSKKSAALYQNIWTDEGSPLLVYSKALCDRVQAQLGESYCVALGMRYGKPSVQSAFAYLQAQQVQKIIVLPLFPQYSSAATQSALDEVNRVARKLRFEGTLSIKEDFYNAAEYIDNMAALIAAHSSDSDFYLFSYHGIPVRQLDKGYCTQGFCDRHQECPAISEKNARCYRAQCMASSRHIAEKLNLSRKEYAITFQSRLGRTEWIRPYTDKYLEKLIAKGIKNVTVVCPSFVADCLETLEEIGMREKARWKKLGGESLNLVPALNANPKWVAGVARIITSI